MPSEPTIQDLFSLKDKVALISGATGHLGSAMARALAEAGANVVVSSRSRERGQEFADSLPVAEGQSHHAVVMDQKDEASIHTAFAAAINKAGQVDIVVNNGTQGAANDLTDVNYEQFCDQLENAAGYFVLGRKFRDHIARRQVTGSLVLIGSMYGVVGSYPEVYAGVCPASPVAYHALKGAVVQLTRHLAAYWAADGIRVNCLSPGPFPNQNAPQEMVERLNSKNPMRRMGVPHELKGAIVFLASEASSFYTGQNMLVDGGWTAW